MICHMGSFQRILSALTVHDMFLFIGVLVLLCLILDDNSIVLIVIISLIFLNVNLITTTSLIGI